MFAQALADITGRLEGAKAAGLLDAYALIGGFAVSAWGVPRASHDLDFALALGTAQPAALSAYLHATFQAGDAHDPPRGVFRTQVTVEAHSIPVQLLLLPPAWNRIVFGDLRSLSVFGCTVPVVSWLSLILVKLYAGGSQDLLDAKQVLAVRQPSASELEGIGSLAAEVGLSEAWHSLISH